MLRDVILPSVCPNTCTPRCQLLHSVFMSPAHKAGKAHTFFDMHPLLTGLNHGLNALFVCITY